METETNRRMSQVIIDRLRNRECLKCGRAAVILIIYLQLKHCVRKFSPRQRSLETYQRGNSVQIASDNQ